MTDVHNKATRSYSMSRMKVKNTKPQIPVPAASHDYRTTIEAI